MSLIEHPPPPNAVVSPTEHTGTHAQRPDRTAYKTIKDDVTKCLSIKELNPRGIKVTPKIQETGVSFKVGEKMKCVKVQFSG